ncbi:sugar O-acetyltransferase [Schleiferilactobacillus harbinensis]|jgi:maltose O-acetyltransferase|uniref:sugar O-acetyltransferase n=1 Tax=Schleiferilactobacillus harbinensis TaxID=304207 RepID=UPI0024310E37|nr:sugar O-acetyltransferase [Schleiferilactobacillus harbinensis]MCI1686715.1 sugar O-acetyltransferase [Schleiferilactobacillus harbinensis]MCI1784497.1 sugar O-acetyltransferase [Schleiferilactobacillus harbinensis]MCI1849323.1 sugar O-acetyltransferase [Schleiferilactobacillus harbinensis]
METMNERMLAGKLYKAADAEIRAASKRGSDLVWKFNHIPPQESAKRLAVLKDLFASVGKHYYIEPPFYADYGSHTTIGEDFYANTGCVFLDTAPITIGQRVYMAPSISLYTAGHPIDAAIRAEDLEYGKAITIGNDVWIGGGTIINPGVTVGSDVVIGSGSVVTRDIPDHVVAAGNPARVLRSITEKDRTVWQAQKDEFLHWQKQTGWK